MEVQGSRPPQPWSEAQVRSTQIRGENLTVTLGCHIFTICTYLEVEYPGHLDVLTRDVKASRTKV